ncbi:MAG: DUF6531 domain-containing protein [Bdellovibrionales bacterium]
MRLLLLVLSLTVSLEVFAVVDMKNANFTDNWVDYKQKSKGFNLDLERTYNSRTLHNGILGFGWCTSLETKLQTYATGNIKVQVCGAGQETFFYPKGFKKADLNKIVQTIFKAHKKAGNGLNKKQEKQFLADLQADPKMRANLAEQYRLNFKIKKGQVLVADTRGLDSLKFDGKQYIRTRADNIKEFYDIKGRLVRLLDTNKNTLTYSYRGNKLVQIKDRSGLQINFKYGSNDKISQITGPKGLKVTYRYKGSDLVFVENAWGNKYSYTYDDLHNLTKITYPDKTTREVKYDKNKDWVIGFKDRKNCTEDYKYDFNKKDPKNHYWTTLVKKCGKKVTNRSRFEFWFKTRKPSGKYLARVKTVVNSKVTDISYHPKFNRPIKELRNGVETKISYYKNGLIKTRKVGNKTSTFKYENRFKKVSQVKSGKTLTRFKYDDRGNLSFASNNRGQKVSLRYDRTGRIVKLIDQAKKVVDIKYDDTIGRPSRVERPGLGVLKIKYKSNGDIQKVDSSSGPAVAVQVASTFNSLLEIVRPAGVELGI